METSITILRLSLEELCCSVERNNLPRDYFYYFLIRYYIQSTVRKKMAAVYFTQYLANQTKPTRHLERYGLMAVVPTLTALLLSSLNDLQFFFVFLYAFLEFSCIKHCR